MGFLKSSTPRGPSASQIRKEEEARIKKENLQALRQQESQRQRLRSNVLDPDDEEIQRKKLLGE